MATFREAPLWDPQQSVGFNLGWVLGKTLAWLAGRGVPGARDLRDGVEMALYAASDDEAAAARQRVAAEATE